MITLTLSPVTPTIAKTAAAAVATYPSSNRTNVPRLVGTLAAALTVVKTGKSVEITALFPASDVPGGTSQYHLAHRVLSVGAIRPYWESVQIVALKDATDTGNVVTGQPSTTTKSGRVFISPVE